MTPDLELFIGGWLLENDYCIGAPDFTPSDKRQTEGNLKLAKNLAAALMEAGLVLSNSPTCTCGSDYRETHRGHTMDCALMAGDSQGTPSGGAE